MVKNIVKEIFRKLSGGSDTSKNKRKKSGPKPVTPKSPQQTRDPVTGNRIPRRDDD